MKRRRNLCARIGGSYIVLRDYSFEYFGLSHKKIGAGKRRLRWCESIYRYCYWGVCLKAAAPSGWADLRVRWCAQVLNQEGATRAGAVLRHGPSVSQGRTSSEGSNFSHKGTEVLGDMYLTPRTQAALQRGKSPHGISQSTADLRCLRAITIHSECPKARCKARAQRQRP